MLLDKTNAGERLADELVDRGIDPDVVLGILGGGLPVADVVSDRLNVPLEVTATKQITPPGDPGYEVGAVTADGIAWYESERLQQIDSMREDLQPEEERAKKQAARKRDAYLDSQSPPELKDKRVLIVDDRAATGPAIRACIESANAAGATRIVVAFPVAPLMSAQASAMPADEVISLETLD